MRSYLLLTNSFDEELPSAFLADDVRYPKALVQAFLDEYTQPGDIVFDPFAGYGTTLITAEAIGRQAYGLELNQAKVDYARNRLQHPERLVLGDARRLSTYKFPLIDFSMTSPPYTSLDDALDPLTDYTSDGHGYGAYLAGMRNIYAQLSMRLKPGGTVVIEAANIKRNGRLTTLAWDIARVVSEVLHFEGEVVIAWDCYGYGYDHSYCLVFTRL